MSAESTGYEQISGYILLEIQLTKPIDKNVFGGTTDKCNISLKQSTIKNVIAETLKADLDNKWESGWFYEDSKTPALLSATVYCSCCLFFEDVFLCVHCV